MQPRKIFFLKAIITGRERAAEKLKKDSVELKAGEQKAIDKKKK